MPAPVELEIWSLAEHFHWTPDQIRQLSMGDLHAFYLITKAQEKAKDG